jgi:hypothetical protein
MPALNGVRGEIRTQVPQKVQTSVPRTT